MGLFSISCFKSYYYLLTFWILDLSIIIVRDIYLNQEISDKENLKGTELIYISCLNISDFLAGFLVLYTELRIKPQENENDTEKKISKKEKSKKHKSKNKKKIKIIYDLIYNDKSIRKHKYYYLFLISILEFIARSTDLLYLLILKKFPIRPGEINWLISVDIFARILFSNLILKNKIYNHHIFSLILIIIGLCSMSICAFKAIKENELDSWPYFLFITGKYLLLPLEDVINKILLTNEFLLPHYLMLWRGFFNFFMLIILATTVLALGEVKFVYFSQFKTDIEIFLQVLMKILFTIFSFCKAFCLLKVIDIFSPQHVAFLNTAFTLYQLLKCRTKAEDNIILTAIDGFFLLVIIFGTLVFNEMIIINICGLNRNTKIELIIKEHQEILNIKSTNDSDEDIENEGKSKDKEKNKDDNKYINNDNDNDDIEQESF